MEKEEMNREKIPVCGLTVLLANRILTIPSSVFLKAGIAVQNIAKIKAIGSKPNLMLLNSVLEADSGHMGPFTFCEYSLYIKIILILNHFGEDYNYLDLL